MGTPRKNLNYYSPYSQNVGQYPSQTSDYMSQHAGGLQSPSFNAPDRRQPNSNQNTPHFYQNNSPQSQNCGFYEDKQSSSPNTPHFYQNKSQHQQQDSRRSFGFRGGRGRGGGKHQNYQQHQRQFGDRNLNNSSQYFHSSMLEDPWQELMERHNAIHGSVVNDDEKTTALNA